MGTTPVRVTSAPTIETTRLRLRSHKSADFVNVAAMWSDPQVVRFIGGEPSDPTKSWARLLSYAGLWQLLGFGYWLVEEKQSGAYVGDVGFANYRRNMKPAGISLPEAGWVLSPVHHGKGYGSEAVGAMCDWADQNFTTDSFCIIDRSHQASERLATKMGFQLWQEGELRGTPLNLFRRAKRSPS